MKKNKFSSFTNSRGQSTLLVALSSIFLLTLAGFASDLGQTYLTRQNLRKMADAAAMAAVVQTPTHAQALTIAQGIANLNEDGASAYVASGDVEVGNYNFNTRTFTAGDPLNADTNKAVRVMVRREGGSPLGLVFGPFVGYTNINLNARAVAAADVPLCGLIGVVDVDVTGTSLVDSYQSENGAYSPGKNSDDNGSLCSDGNITLNGTVNIQGDALPGKGDSVILKGGATVSGSKDPRSSKLILAAVDLGNVASINDDKKYPAVAAFIDSQFRFSMKPQDTLTLPGGIYYFTEMTSKGTITVSGSDPVIIFVDGNVDIGSTGKVGGGGILNPSKDPSLLQIFATGTSVKYSGKSEFYGLMYAPNADIAITGTPGVFGAVIGNTFKINGTPKIHYDESLDPFWNALRPVPVLVE